MHVGYVDLIIEFGLDALYYVVKFIKMGGGSSFNLFWWFAFMRGSDEMKMVRYNDI